MAVKAGQPGSPSTASAVSGAVACRRAADQSYGLGQALALVSKAGHRLFGGHRVRGAEVGGGLAGSFGLLGVLALACQFAVARTRKRRVSITMAVVAPSSPPTECQAAVDQFSCSLP
ncbi:hypothetical protein ACWGJT_29155 [Streptomyces xantholiticus]